MVTVIHVSPSEAIALAATESWSSGEADSIIKRSSTPTNDGNNEERSGNNEEVEKQVELQVGFRTITVQQRGAVRPTPTPAQPTTTPTNSNNNSNNKNNGGALSTSEDIVIGNETKRRQRAAGFEIDLSDVPPQLPIPKSSGRIKEGASKYTGVYFNKALNKWMAQISIEGKNRRIGSYVNEEEAAIDYARAVYKYQGQEALDKARERNNSSVPSIDLSDVPPQLPIPKSKGRMKEGEASKYAGVYSYKGNHNWRARITIEGKLRNIGYYENEEEAAADYARAVFKYKGQEALNKVREQNLSIDDVDDVPPQPKRQRLPDPEFVLDLTDVPPQQPIPKRKGKMKEGSSKYTGVYFHKESNKWMARIRIGGKQYSIGFYENEEEAAIDYARAVFKYRRLEE